jgi:glycosyltransferase involved in cell wall biosynthesis
MVKERRQFQIGIIFDYNSGWIGGTYYILNLLNAIASLPTVEQPTIVIYGENNKGYLLVKKEISLKKLRFKKITNVYSNILIILINKIWRIFGSSNIFEKGPSNRSGIIFPNPMGSYFKKVPYPLFWIPDFQEKYYPHFFTDADLKFRENYNRVLITRQCPIVFSSKNTMDDFKKFYPEAINTTYLLPFAVSLPDFSDINFEILKNTYLLNTPYFITPNQFWVHKNHNIVIEAASLVIAQGYKCKFLFSGKEYDSRCPEYTKLLKESVKVLKLDGSIKFLGFLQRKILLQLMSNSCAVIQPSLFEGWSTVVEDGKALNKVIIASNLSVHVEQMRERGIYFNPLDAKDLASKIIEQLKCGNKTIDWQYALKKKEFGRKFIDIVNKVCS